MSATLPPFMLHPGFAREDGKVRVVLVLDVPLPPDPSVPLPLAEAIAGADLLDCYATREPEETEPDAVRSLIQGFAAARRGAFPEKYGSDARW